MEKEGGPDSFQTGDFLFFPNRPVVAERKGGRVGLPLHAVPIKDEGKLLQSFQFSHPTVLQHESLLRKCK